MAQARFYVPEIERGMNLSWGAVPRVTHLVGPARTKRMIILSEKVPAERAADWGFVDELALEGGALEAALALAERTAAMPPVQLRMIKQAVNASAGALDRAVSHADFDQFMLASASGDFAEGVNAFLERRAPNYTGR
ncbi:MAG: enoyl-CoA hydratase-related protein [Burkholderiaceae bacterium]